MDLQTEKIELAKWILEIEDPAILSRIRDVVASIKKPEDGSVTEYEIREIELGIEQLDAGQSTSFKEFMSRYS